MWDSLAMCPRGGFGVILIRDTHNPERKNMVVLHKVWPIVEMHQLFDRRLTKAQFYKRCREVEGSLTHTLEDADAIETIRVGYKQAGSR